MRRPLAVLSSHRTTSCCLVASAGCRAIISRRPLVAPPSRPLIVLASLLCRLSLRRPCRQTLLPPLDTTATVTIKRRLYRPPLPQLPAITIATVKCQRPPLSIAAVKR
jgi:hypothetical protein